MKKIINVNICLIIILFILIGIKIATIIYKISNNLYF